MKKAIILIALLALSYALSCCKKREICGQGYATTWQVGNSLVYAKTANGGEFDGIDGTCAEYHFNMMNPWALIAGQQIRYQNSYQNADTIFLIYSRGYIDTAAFIRVK